MNIPDVPKTITRAQYLKMITDIGLDPDRTLSLQFTADGIYAEVAATKDDGSFIIDKMAQTVARHRLHIRVED